MTNSVETDQTPRSATSDLGLHRLLWPVCPNTKGWLNTVDSISYHTNAHVYLSLKGERNLKRLCAIK